MNIKNLILPVVIVVAIAGYVAYRQFAGNPTPAPVTNNNPSNQPTNQNPTQTGYKDGQYTGAVASTVYGDDQVKVTISGGKITNIEMVKTPTGPGHTAQLVASSFPILISEAIVAQSAKVNVVSGATQNSEGFSQSLSSALMMAS